MKYENYKRNLGILELAPEQDLGNEFVLSGIIDKFTMQFELAWKLLRCALEYEGRLEAATGSPRGIIKAAYSAYDFIDEDIWLRMLDDRNAAQHVYDETLAKRLVASINSEYIPVLKALILDLERIYSTELLGSF